MSILDDILAGISGGLRGGVQGYELGQDLQDRKANRARQTQELQLRQQEHADLEQQRADSQSDRQAAAAAKAQADAEAAADRRTNAQRDFIKNLPDGPTKRHLMATWGSDLGLNVNEDDLGSSDTDPHSAIEPMLPSWLQGPYHASGHTAKFSPEQWAAAPQPPQTPDQKRKEQLDMFRQEEAIRHSYDKPPAEPKLAPTDDPSLPNGARQYIASLPNKYGGDYAQADAEFRRELPGLLAAHPRMDLRKARQAFDAGFSAQARELAISDFANAAGGPKGSVPVTPRSTAPQPATSPTPDGGSALPQTAAARASAAQPSDAASQRTVTPEQIEGVARMRGTSPDVERARAAAEGFTITSRGPSADDIGNATRNITDADIAALARTVLTGNGVPASDENIRTFVERNRARLVQEVNRNRRRAQAATADGASAQAPARSDTSVAALTTKANALLSQFAAERDPERKAALRAQLAQLRQQLAAAKGQQ